MATATATRAHWHVHSTLGSGYLCECESHTAYMTLRERDSALRFERDTWRDYIASADPDDGADYRITGSVRAGWFDIDDRASFGWSRVVRSWECDDPTCYQCGAEYGASIVGASGAGHPTCDREIDHDGAHSDSAIDAPSSVIWS